MMPPSAPVIGFSLLGSAAILAVGVLVRSVRARRSAGAARLSADERHELDTLRRSHARLLERWSLLQGRARETERELASLSYSVSHDLRAPLRGIDGFSQALTEDYGHRLDATAHDYLRRVRANAVQMNALIDDLLSLARVARAPFRAESVDISALARDIARALSALDPVRLVRWEIPPNIVAVADRELLTEALRQLLANAWKFTSVRDVAQVSLQVLPPDPEHPAGPVYQVRDNGVGFDMRYAGKLFGAFQRMHPPEEFPAGRGIGLATVQRIVHRHHGQVWAEASPAQGARFSFTLAGVPVSPAAEDFSALGGLATLPAEAGAAGVLIGKTTTV